MNNVNIVYIKTDDYDNSSSSSSSSDTESYSTDSMNIQSIKENNKLLRNNITKELSNNLTNCIVNENTLNKFIFYLKINNTTLQKLEDKIEFNKLVKHFIINNNFEKEYILPFLKLIEKNLNVIKEELKNMNNTLLKENFSEIKQEDKVLLSSFNDTANNNILNNSDNMIIDKLINNDINTWLFVGIIVISLIILVMIMIKH